MKELWYLILVVLMLTFLASFSSLVTPTSAFIANLPPQWDYPTTEFAVNDRLELDLTQAFFDPDADPLSFSVSPGPGVSAGVYGDNLIVLGQGELIITVSDGQHLVSQKIILI